jgi:hypothetical protein
MADPISFDPYFGWVNITDPNNIPEDARTLTAEDLLRYEQLGVDVVTKVNEQDASIALLDSDTAVAASLATEGSLTRAAIQTMVDGGVADFQEVIDAVPAQVDAQLDIDVPPAVAAAIAADGTVATAAAAAVDTALDGAGVMTGAGEILGADTIAFSIADQNGNRSWLEVATTGGPTPEAATAIATAIEGPVSDIVEDQLATAAIPSIIPSSAPAVFSVVSSEDQRSWLEVAEDGGPTDHTIEQLQTRLVVPEATPPTEVAVPYGSSFIKTASGPDITLFGDSMTAADWATTLASLTGRTVNRRGVGGETSAGIAARANAMPYIMLPNGGAIPASGGVTVALSSAGGGNSWPLLQGSGTGNGYMDGVLAGIPGRVTLVKPTVALPTHGSDDYYVFTRTTAGSVVPVTRPQPFYYDDGALQRGNIWVIWSGRNNFAEDNGDRAFRDIKAMTNYLNALDKRFLVLAVHNGSNEGIGTTNYPLITGVNKRLLAEYGRRFVDHRRYLIDYGLSDLGITPTAQDTTDVAADTVPQSLRTDTIHQTVDARGITASQVNLRLRELGWV